jgi:hypothetical protein
MKESGLSYILLPYKHKRQQNVSRTKHILEDTVPSRRNMPEGLILEADGDDFTLENASGLKDSCTVIATSRYGLYGPLSLPNSSAID